MKDPMTFTDILKELPDDEARDAVVTHYTSTCARADEFPDEPVAQRAMVAALDRAESKSRGSQRAIRAIRRRLETEFRL
jgi:hypothetical protein